MIVTRLIDNMEVPCKFCSSCCEWKPIYMFCRSSRDKDGLKPWCKECNNIANRRTRLKYKSTGKVYKWTVPEESILWDINDEEVNDAETF